MTKVSDAFDAGQEATKSSFRELIGLSESVLRALIRNEVRNLLDLSEATDIRAIIRAEARDLIWEHVDSKHD